MGKYRRFQVFPLRICFIFIWNLNLSYLDSICKYIHNTLCWLILWILDASQSHLGGWNFSWENASTGLACVLASDTFTGLVLDVGGPSLLGSVKKAQMRNQWRTTAMASTSAPTSRFLPWVPSLNSLSDEQWLGDISWNKINPFLHKLPLAMVLYYVSRDLK